jgi:molybdopterin-guanine dinucleotide biosynthesis protein A
VTRLPGVLLTGGASRRMGTDKATIVWRGETLAARAARVLASVCDPVLEVGDGVSGLPSVREEPVGGGPVRALLRGAHELGDAAERGVVVLACDMPFVESPLLALLATWPGTGTVVLRRDGHAQYLCARYSAEWIARAAATGATSFREMSTSTDVVCEYVDEGKWREVAPPNALDDVDTPEDRARTIPT